MTEVVGDLWSEIGVADIILVTTNATINSKGELVMGRGAAKEARDRYPRLARDLGDRILKWREKAGDAPYHILLSAVTDRDTTIGAFQVKKRWWDAADIGIIRGSVAAALLFVESTPRLAMNYPGIGNGRLQITTVEPIIRQLPNNVVVYRDVRGDRTC